MPNYAPSTRARIADLVAGMFVETATFSATTYLHRNQVEAFDIHGRVLIYQYFMEAITAIDGAALVAFNYTFSTPSVAVSSFSGNASAGSIDAFAVGSRITWAGGTFASNTAPAITVAAGCFSDALSANPCILGCLDAIGTIGWVTTSADCSAGTMRAGILYVPLSVGAYIAAKETFVAVG